VAYIFIDVDNSVLTGYYVNEFIGADYMINISGKDNNIISNYINRFNATGHLVWNWIIESTVNAAVDSKALEAQIDFDTLNISQDNPFNVWFFTTDWMECYDLSDYGIGDTRSQRGSRAPGGSKVVINEVFPDANGWVELYNTAGQTEDRGHRQLGDCLG
jgi:hypothetical protein